MAQVTVVRGKWIVGWTGEDNHASPPCPHMDINEALSKQWGAADVYLCGYGNDAPAGRRLRKSALARWELTGESAPTLNVAFVDVDSPNHAPLCPQWAAAQIAKVPQAIADNMVWYHTPHGFRLVVLPHQAIPLSHANSYLRQLHEALEQAGVAVDPTSAQWTRLMRAPHARNQSLPMGGKLAPTAWRPPVPLTAEHATAYGQIVERTDWRAREDKLTKDFLEPLSRRDKGLAAALYHKRVEVPVGGRHAFFVAAACTIQAAYDSADPGTSYELLARPFKDSGKEDMAELERICTWAAALHSGERAEAAAERKALTSVAARTMKTAGVDVRRRLVVDAGAEFWVWDESRLTYAGGFTHQHQLLPALARHCPTLAGDLLGCGPAEVYLRASVSVRRVVYTYDPTEAGLELDGPQPTFRHCIVQVDDTLVPQRHADVERWLHTMFASNLDRALDWLAMFPQLTKPVCALYLDAAPSVGKFLLAAGLARIWSRESAFTTYDALSDSFQGELLGCPLIVADEKAETAAGKQESDSSVFRRSVGNTVLTVNEKYRVKARLVGAPRLLITANNPDALRIREELSQDDLEAVRLRLGYVRVADDAPARVLAELAAEQGYRSSREMTESWVAGGKLAEHVLWLSQTRDVQPGHRLYVEGWESALTERLATSAGSAGVVVGAVVNAVLTGYDGPAVRVEGGAVYVHPNHLAAAWERVIGNRADKCPHPNGRLSAVRSLSDGNKQRLSRTDLQGKRVQEWYWQINPERLAAIAEERGLAIRSEFLAIVARGGLTVAPTPTDTQGEAAAL